MRCKSVFLILATQTACAGMPAMWNHASPGTDIYNEFGYTRGTEPNPEKIRDPVLKTVAPKGVQDGGSYLLQFEHLNFKLHSDPATSFWFGLSSTSNAKKWGFTGGLDISITPWPQTFEYRYDLVEGSFGIDYPVTIRREGRFSAFAFPAQFEFRPSKYFVPIFGFNPVMTGVSSKSSVKLVEPFEDVPDIDPFLRMNLEKKREEERKKDGGSRYLLVAGLGFRSQIGSTSWKFMYVDRRLDSFQMNDHFRQMFHLSVGIFTGSKLRPGFVPAPVKPPEPAVVPPEPAAKPPEPVRKQPVKKPAGKKPPEPVRPIPPPKAPVPSPAPVAPER